MRTIGAHRAIAHAALCADIRTHLQLCMQRRPASGADRISTRNSKRSAGTRTQAPAARTHVEDPLYVRDGLIVVALLNLFVANAGSAAALPAQAGLPG